MAAQPGAGRPNQRSRTRKDLLQAAARLLKQGRKPSLDEIAAEALVSRATAYRYFPNVEALLIEAPLDSAVPEPDELFRGAPADDAIARVERVDAMLDAMMQENEASLRLMLAQSMQRAVQSERNAELPPRQNRRTPLIEAALAPTRDQFKPAAFKNLSRALALVLGTEAMVVFKDVLQLDDAEARKVRRWAIRALIEAAKK
jgi:AcrR family transcriptional regulator